MQYVFLTADELLQNHYIVKKKRELASQERASMTSSRGKGDTKMMMMKTIKMKDLQTLKKILPESNYFNERLGIHKRHERSENIVSRAPITANASRILDSSFKNERKEDGIESIRRKIKNNIDQSESRLNNNPVQPKPPTTVEAPQSDMRQNSIKLSKNHFSIKLHNLINMKQATQDEPHVPNPSKFLKNKIRSRRFNDLSLEGANVTLEVPSHLRLKGQSTSRQAPSFVSKIDSSHLMLEKINKHFVLKKVGLDSLDDLVSANIDIPGNQSVRVVNVKERPCKMGIYKTEDGRGMSSRKIEPEEQDGTPSRLEQNGSQIVLPFL